MLIKEKQSLDDPSFENNLLTSQLSLWILIPKGTNFRAFGPFRKIKFREIYILLFEREI